MRFGIAALALAVVALAEGFKFQIGSPVASQEFPSKTAAFVFRIEGCADPAKSQISGTAEGLVNGERRSVALKVTAMSKPGVYAVYQTWPSEGAWVVNLKGTCASENAGAVVPIGPRGFIRESSKFFTRPATGAEIKTSLDALPQGGNK
jgi:hypothetical protein